MSAQPHFRARAQRRDRDAELERLVAAELDACEMPIDTMIEPAAPANPIWNDDLSGAERDFVDLVRQWLDRRPNKHQLVQLICEGVMPVDGAASTPQPAAGVETSSADIQPDLPAEPDSHAAP